MADDVDREQAQSEVRATKAKNAVAAVLLPKAKDVPPIEPVADAGTEKMKADVTRQIMRSKLKREMSAELDPEGENEAVVQEVHRSLPKMLFLVGSRAVNCPRMALDDEEAEIFADALSMWLPKIDSKIYALVVMLCLVASKLLDCQDAIAARISSVQKHTKRQTVKFDKKREAVVTT